MTASLKSIYLDLPAGSALVFAATASHILAYDLQLGPVVQLPTALLFFLTCPGAPLIDWVRLPNWPSRVALVLGVSLAVNILIVTLLLTSGSYSASAGLGIIGSVSVALALYTSIAKPATAASRLRLHPL